MADVFGYEGFQYEYVPGWPNIPEGYSLLECPGVAVDSQDNVYLLTRGDHPLMQFDKDGNFIKSFGEGYFSNRTHGLYIAHDDTLLVADDGIHTIQQFNSAGEQLFELGNRNNPSPKWGGEPFNRPTSAAIRPSNGDWYVSDGYGNARVHVYTSGGDYKFSWGSPGIDAGEFMRPHNIAFDGEDRVYVVDREAHRIQVFDAEGQFITMWSNIHRPDAMVLWQDHIYVGELNGIGGFDSPNMGHRVEVFDLTGKLVCRFGAPVEGEGPGEFVAPHGIAVDSEGSLYVAEVSYTIMGRQLDPPREMRSISKYKRRW